MFLRLFRNILGTLEKIISNERRNAPPYNGPKPPSFGSVKWKTFISFIETAKGFLSFADVSGPLRLFDSENIDKKNASNELLSTKFPGIFPGLKSYAPFPTIL